MDQAAVTPRAGISAFAFVLAVPDLDATTAYFRDVLGFAANWAERSDWRLLVRDQVRMMIGHCPDAMPPRDTGDHSYFGYLHVDDVDRLHAEFARRGAIVLQPPNDRPWGMREMLVATPDGHRLMFGQELRKPADP